MTQVSGPSQPIDESPKKVGTGIGLLIEALKPWKEIITILVFFGGGTIWIAGYFATKRQLDDLRCYARESIAAARAETTLRTSFEDIIQKSHKVDILDTKSKESSLGESERIEKRRLEQEIKILEDKRKTASIAFDKAEKTLTDGVCSMEK